MRYLDDNVGVEVSLPLCQDGDCHLLPEKFLFCIYIMQGLRDVKSLSLY